MDLKNHTYKISFNSFGIIHIIAPSFQEAIKMFEDAQYGGDDVAIKTIERLDDFQEPLYPKK